MCETVSIFKDWNLVMNLYGARLCCGGSCASGRSASGGSITSGVKVQGLKGVMCTSCLWGVVQIQWMVPSRGLRQIGVLTCDD